MRSRCWVFTLNNYVEEDIERIKSIAHRYLVFGREIGASGTKHLQGYVAFENARTKPSVIKLLGPTTYVSVRNGSHEQASEYCKKEGDYFESGSRPDDPKDKGAKTQATWTEIVKHAKEGDMAWVEIHHPKVFVLHKPRLESIYAPVVTPMDGDLLHEWWVGSSGTGKSKTLWELYPDHFEKPLNKWWDGYNHEPVVAIEEWSPANSCTTSALKRWADRYPFAGEIKGGTKQRLRPKKVIVLSNYKPDQCFTTQEDLGPIMRRFAILEFPKDIQRARFRHAWFTNQPIDVESPGPTSQEDKESVDISDVDFASLFDTDMEDL